MSRRGITEAFARFGAKLRNPQWSVSSWADADTLVVSLWAHHRLKEPDSGTLEFGDRLDRWAGPGNAEFRANVQEAFRKGATVRLVIVRTLETDRVERGEDASKIKKTFAPRSDLIGRIKHVDETSYVIQFVRVSRPLAERLGKPAP